MKIIIFLLLIVFKTSVYSEENFNGNLSPYLSLEAWVSNDVASISSFNNNLNNDYFPREGVNNGILRMRTISGIQSKDWMFGFEYRKEGDFVVSSDTLKMYKLYQQKLNPTQNTSFLLYGNQRSWQTQGLTSSYSVIGNQNRSDAVKKSNLIIKAALYLNPIYTEKKVEGAATYYSNNSISFDTAYSGNSSEYSYPFKINESSRAVGYSISVHGDQIISSNLNVSWQLNDVLSKIYFKNMPGFLRNYNSTTSSYDNQGFVNYAPLMTGQNYQNDFSSSIGMSTIVSAQYKRDRWSYFLGVSRYPDLTIPKIGVSYASSHANFLAEYETRFKAYKLGVSTKDVYLTLMSNSLSVKRASALGIQLNYRSSY